MKFEEFPTYGAGARPINVANFEAEAQTLECATYSLESFLYLEARHHPDGTGSLEQVFDYWCQLDGSVPSSFKPLVDIPTAAESIRAVIDVRNADPMEFVLADHKVCSSTGRANGWRGKPLGKIGIWTEYLRIRAMHYNLCRRTGVPSFHEIKHDISGLSSHFVVLLLPVSEAISGETVSVYSCVARQSENRLLELNR